MSSNDQVDPNLGWILHRKRRPSRNRSGGTERRLKRAGAHALDDPVPRGGKLRSIEDLDRACRGIPAGLR